RFVACTSSCWLAIPRCRAFRRAGPFRTSAAACYAWGMNSSSPADDPSRLPAIEPEPALLPWPGSTARQPSEAAQRAELRELTAHDLAQPRQRRVVTPFLLFIATCASTFIAGATNWNPIILFESNQVGQVLRANWQQGLAYMAAVLGILLMHEMGHFL